MAANRPTPAAESDRARFGVYEEYLRRYGAGRPTDQRPRRRGQDWVPRRCCHADWILSVYVARWNRVHYDVGLFLAEDLYLLERESGVKAGLMFVLSDAYYQTGKMAVSFCGPASGRPTLQTGYEPGIPASVAALAAELGVPVESSVSEFGPVRKTTLSDKTGRALYARITGLSRGVIDALNRPGCSIDLVRACFIVQRGVWQAEQVEYLARAAPNPARLLEGGVAPERRVAFQADLLVMRTAVAWERARTILERLSGEADAVITPVVWDGPTAEFMTDRDIRVNVTSGERVEVLAGAKLRLLLLPRTKLGYEAMWSADLRAVRSKRYSLVVVTSDYADLAAGPTGFEACGITVLKLLDSVADLDSEAVRRLARSASTRREMPEHPE